MVKVFGIVALIFGIFSWVIWGITISFIFIKNDVHLPNPFIIFFFEMRWIISALAIIFGIFGKIVDEPKELAKAGLLLGIISIALSILLEGIISSILLELKFYAG